MGEGKQAANLVDEGLSHDAYSAAQSGMAGFGLLSQHNHRESDRSVLQPNAVLSGREQRQILYITSSDALLHETTHGPPFNSSK